MAIYHLRVKYVKRGEGRSVVAAAAYRSGTRLNDERNGMAHDYTRKQNIEYTALLLPDNAPASMADRGAFWNAIENGIKHPRAQPAMEIEAALPRELSKEACVRLVREFAHDLFVQRGVPVDIAIHRPMAADGGEQPHVHFLIATRRLTPEGGIGAAARDMQDNPALVQKVYALEHAGKLDEALLLEKDLNLGRWRKAWADYSNRFLADADSAARIDHRTLAAQAVAREPKPYIGLAYSRLRTLTGTMAGRVREFQERAFRNAMRDQFDRLGGGRPHLMAEFLVLAREYGQTLFPELQPTPAGQPVSYDRR